MILTNEDVSPYSSENSKLNFPILESPSIVVSSIKNVLVGSSSTFIILLIKKVFPTPLLPIII